MTATYGIAIHHSDDGLGQTAYLHLHVEHIEAWHSVGSDISATSLDVHVASCTERLVACSGEDDHSYVLTLTAIAEGLRHLPCGEGCEGIAITLSVDGYLGYVMIFFEDDFLEIKSFYLFPFSHIVVFMFNV